jgi:hypothetical protein
MYKHGFQTMEPNVVRLLLSNSRRAHDMVDQATLHKPKYCRILLGCRDVDAMPHVVEGVLGDYFYDFAYEVETVVVRGPPADRSWIPVSSAPVPPSPKRPRIEHSMTETLAASSEGQTAPGSFSGTGNYGKTCNQQLPTVPEHESEEESELDSSLLIDQIVQENLLDTSDNISVDECDSIQSPVLESSFAEKSMVLYEHVGSSGIAPFTPVVEKEVISPDVVTKKGLSYAAVVSGTPSGPAIIELEDNQPSPMESASYFVQSPVDGGPGEESGDKISPSVAGCNCHEKNNNSQTIMEQAAALAKKKDLEGNASSYSSGNINRRRCPAR